MKNIILFLIINVATAIAAFSQCTADFISSADNSFGCVNQVVNFYDLSTPTTGLTYSWNFGPGATPATSTLQNPTVVYSTAGPKTVQLNIVRPATGCTDNFSNDILIVAAPTVSFTSNAPVCAGSAVNFTYTGSTATNYAWDFGADASPAISTAQSPSGIIYSKGGVKTVTLTISNGNCIATQTQSITINALPTVNAGNDTTICANKSVQIGGSPSAGFSYSWTPSGTLSNPNIANPVASPIAPQTKYTLTVTETATGCQNTGSVTVNMLSPIAAYAGSDVVICRGDSIQIGLPEVKGQTYRWIPTSGVSNSTIANPKVSPSSTQQYTVVVKYANCDSVTDQVFVTVNTLPAANAGPDVTISKGSETQLVATGGVMYQWSPSLGLSNSSISDPIAKPDTTTNYIATVTDMNSCVNTDTVIVTVVNPSFWLPSAFTPNDDGRNDVLYVRGIGINNFEFSIFNRLGELIFYSKNISSGWDGSMGISGEPGPVGAYVYQVTGILSDDSPLNQKGLVNLIR